jgi:hypothetical protein
LLDKIAHTVGIGMTSLGEEIVPWIFLIITLPAWVPIWLIGAVVVHQRKKLQKG